MLNSFLHVLAKAVAVPLIFILSAAGFPPSQPQVKQLPIPDYSQDIQHIKIQIADLQLAEQQPSFSQNLGGTNVLPQNVAFFSTSLASGISSTATTMTLVSATYNNGVSTLASSTYAFVIDEGTATQEMVQADCTSTACTNMTRGLDFLTGTTSVTTLKFSHRRGASVKITTAPTTLIIGNILAGSDVIPGPIKYSSSIATSTLAADRSSVASAGLVADTAFAGAGVINATTAAKGTVEIATAIEVASTTSTGGSGATVVIPASSATSTWNNSTLAALKIPVADNFGKIDFNFISTSSGMFANSTLTGTTTFSNTGTSSIAITATSTLKVGAFSAWQIGKQYKTFTSSGTFQVPWGISIVCAEMVGGGGGGGSSNTSVNGGGGGGGGGGYGYGCFDVSATSTIGVTIGIAGTAGNASAGGNGGTSYFSTFLNCTGGTGGGRGATGGGGGGGSCTGTTVKTTTGQNGNTGVSANPAGGQGGSSILGFGGQGNSFDAVGATGTGFGAGGEGANTSDGSEDNGGAGTAGELILNW